MRDFAEKFYHSKSWRDCRQSFISKRILIDGGMCQECHDSLGYIVHHRITLTPENINNPEVALNHSNLKYVCHECHNKEHDNFVSKSRVYFDDDGNVFEKNFQRPHRDEKIF